MMRHYQKDKRYPSNWNELSDFTLAVTFGQCCNCFVRRAKIAHHVYYPIYLLQLPFICLFGLCRRCHGIAHRDCNWVESLIRPKQWDRNTLEFTMMLQVKMLLLIGLELTAIVFLLRWLLLFVNANLHS